MKKNFCRLGHFRLGLGFALLVSGMAFGQMRSISGSVMDRDMPLSGVTVRQKGTELIAVTDKEGRFQIEVNGSDAVLEFEHPDYEQVSERIGQENRIKVLLSKAVNKIEEVLINAGYYTVKDKERTGSIAKVTAKDIENQPVNNVLSAVQGRMAGVSITQNSGTPGGGFNIQIRGKNSLRNTLSSGSDGNQPLYIIDGMVLSAEIQSQIGGPAIPLGSINPLNAINPNDIESIEILKDADATAIYGSRGANGVILVTTKKGKAGKISAQLNTYLGCSTALIGLKMMNTAQYIDMRHQAFAYNNITNYPATAYDINGTWSPTNDTNWAKEILGNTATSSDTNFSLRGGSSTTNFLLNVGHNEQTSVLGKDFKYYKNSLSANMNHKSSDNKFHLAQSTLLSQQANNLAASDITRQALLLAPNSPQLYASDGNLNWENNTFTNPLAVYNSSYNYNNIQGIYNVNADYEIIRNWKLKLNAGINYQNFQEIVMTPNTIYNPSMGVSPAYSQSSKANRNLWALSIEPQLNYHLKKEKHELDILIGSSYQKEATSSDGIMGIGFTSNALISNPAAATNKIISDNITSQYKYVALFTRINYQFKGKYILNATARRDGSSRFGPNNKYATFGALGLAWLFSVESFLKDSSWLNFGKLRTSYGTTGSDNIGDFQYLNNFVISQNTYNNTTALQPARLYNGDFSWEKTTKLEAALELGKFDNRLNTSIAYYRNRSTNQLVGYQLPAITGFTSVLANLPATVQNWGWEIDITAKPFHNSKVKWQTSVNISLPKNKLLAFPGLEGSTYASQFEIGRSTSIVKLFQLEGIDATTGQYIFTDFNNDGKISAADDKKVIEDLGVKWFGGWSNRLQFKNWEANILWQFVKQKNKNYNIIMPSPGGMSNLPVQALNVWSTTNPTGLYMPYSSTTNTLHNNFQNSTASVSDASFIRLKSVELAYNLAIPNSPISKMKIYLQGQNLHTFTKYFGLDPEFAPAPGFLPTLKTWALGTSLTF